MKKLFFLLVGTFVTIQVNAQTITDTTTQSSIRIGASGNAYTNTSLGLQKIPTLTDIQNAASNGLLDGSGYDISNQQFSFDFKELSGLSGTSLNDQDVMLVQDNSDNVVRRMIMSGLYTYITGKLPANILDGDDNTQLTEAQVDNFVSNNGYATIMDTDFARLSAQEYADANDDVLTEADVDAFVSNNGYATIMDTDFARLAAQQYADDNDDVLSEAQVDAFVANNGYLTEFGGTADTNIDMDGNSLSEVFFLSFRDVGNDNKQWSAYESGGNRFTFGTTSATYTFADGSPSIATDVITKSFFDANASSVSIGSNSSSVLQANNGEIDFKTPTNNWSFPIKGSTGWTFQEANITFRDFNNPTRMVTKNFVTSLFDLGPGLTIQNGIIQIDPDALEALGFVRN